jgi:uncharacterized PurR-regulated membrane protein YhhQ (DUF165 family)
MSIALACALLLVPAMLMGATLPLRSQGLSGDTEKAARALALDGAHVPSAVAASTAALMLGRHADALAQRALAREPGEPKVLFFAGVASWWLGRKDEAQCYVERATAIEPQNVEFRGALARLKGGTLSR